MNDERTASVAELVEMVSGLAAVDAAEERTSPSGCSNRLVLARSAVLTAAPEMARLLQEYEEENAELRQDRDMWKGECASISAELGLPPTIRPKEGELGRLLSLASRGAQLARAVELLRRTRSCTTPLGMTEINAFLAEYDAGKEKL